MAANINSWSGATSATLTWDSTWTDNTSATNWTTDTLQIQTQVVPSRGRQRQADPEPEGPLEWLDGRIDEMCRKGRKALKPAA